VAVSSAKPLPGAPPAARHLVAGPSLHYAKKRKLPNGKGLGQRTVDLRHNANGRGEGDGESCQRGSHVRKRAPTRHDARGVAVQSACELRPLQYPQRCKDQHGGLPRCVKSSRAWRGSGRAQTLGGPHDASYFRLSETRRKISTATAETEDGNRPGAWVAKAAAHTRGGQHSSTRCRSFLLRLGGKNQWWLLLYIRRRLGFWETDRADAGSRPLASVGARVLVTRASTAIIRMPNEYIES
jgi:hypothetical protein